MLRGTSQSSGACHGEGFSGNEEISIRGLLEDNVKIVTESLDPGNELYRWGCRYDFPLHGIVF